MMDLEGAMREALGARPEVAALACMDGRAGMLLGMYVQGDVPRELVELAAFAAPELCTVPRHDEDVAEACDDAFVASESWVHAFARVPERPDLVMVGVAARGANIALLRAWLGDVARHVGNHS